MWSECSTDLFGLHTIEFKQAFYRWGSFLFLSCLENSGDVVALGPHLRMEQSATLLRCSTGQSGAHLGFGRHLNLSLHTFSSSKSDTLPLHDSNFSSSSSIQSTSSLFFFILVRANELRHSAFLVFVFVWLVFLHTLF